MIYFYNTMWQRWIWNLPGISNCDCRITWAFLPHSSYAFCKVQRSWMTHKAPDLRAWAGLLDAQTRRASTRRDKARIGEMAGLQQASRLWQHQAHGIRAPTLLRIGRQRISPLVTAINSLYLEEETRAAPCVEETLPLGNCDPNEFGRPEISPLICAEDNGHRSTLLVTLLQCESQPRYDTSAHQGSDECRQMGRVHTIGNGEGQCGYHKGVTSSR